ncbi:hypothetical protein K9B32_10425 [Rhizobium sp. 3T7]|uniref:hypothetical protein n=1 Tax=Rhizobium sp. 3T7 TaxID=2874922 RepID=UPI001CCAEA94|nr:hypothetical protein [Rhizobium sp. 3T7]MBZ9790534.1 hypothetical protein [Rhizobium sp. 3T7]
MQSNYFKNGVQELSFGPFQLYKGGGLGNAFMAKTGLDPAYAANGPAGVDFALDYAKKNGWGAWYGAGKAGIGDFEGINASVDKFSKSLGGASEAIDVQFRRTTDAASGLGKLATSTGSATDGLRQLGTGLNNFGQKLSTSFFPSAPTVGALALAGLLLLAANAVYNRGYDAGAGKFKAEIAEMKAAAVTAANAETERQEAANNAAKAREAARIVQMQAENETLEKKIEELQREADQDPDAGRVVLGAPSVRPINQIR